MKRADGPALAGAGIAILASGISLAGWASGEALLQGFGIVNYPDWPITAVAHIVLGLALCALTAGRMRLAMLLAILPALIGIGSLFEYATGIRIGLDTLLFATSVSHSALATPGRPGLIPTLSLIALVAGLSSVRRQYPRTGQLVLFTGSLAAGLGLISILLLVSKGGLPHLPYRLTSSFPAAISAIAIALGLLSRQAQHWRTTTFVGRTRAWRTLRVAFPIVLLIRAALIPIGAALAQRGIMPALATEIVGSTLNLAVVVLLLGWAIRALDREQHALADLAAALDISIVAILRPSGEILYWSKGCTLLYGWTSGEAIGRLKAELLQSRPLLPNGETGPIERITSSERLIEQRRHDGSPIHVLEDRRTIERQGRETLTVVSMTDLSDRVAIQRALAESEQRLSLATEAHHVGIFDWDMLTGALSWSAGAEERLGIATGSIGDFDRWSRYVDPADTEQMLAAVEAASAATADRFGFRYRFRPPDGDARVVEGSAHCIYHGDGLLARAVGIIVDVTAHDRREAHLRSIIETMPDAMIVIDRDGIVRDFSPAAERMFGWAAGEVIGTSVTRLMPEAIGEGHSGFIDRYLETGERRVIGLARLLTGRRSNGAHFPIEVNVGEAEVAGERIFTGFIRDISERVAAAERLADLQNEYAHSARLTAMGEVAAGLAHELNQPLAATANFLGAAAFAITRDVNPVESSVLVQQAQTQVQRAGEIIRRLRDFMVKGDTLIRNERIRPIIDDAIALVMLGHGENRIPIILRLDPRVRSVRANRVQIQQLFTNLLRNAAEALAWGRRRSGVITIATRMVEPDMLELSVADNGPGLGTEILANLFQPFMTTKGEGSMGIGLSICRRIVEAHGGELRAENQLGGGARFTFTLPLARRTRDGAQ